MTQHCFLNFWWWISHSSLPRKKVPQSWSQPIYLTPVIFTFPILSLRRFVANIMTCFKIAVREEAVLSKLMMHNTVTGIQSGSTTNERCEIAFPFAPDFRLWDTSRRNCLRDRQIDMSCCWNAKHQRCHRFPQILPRT